MPLTFQYLPSLDALTSSEKAIDVAEKNRLKLASIVYVQSSCENPMQRDDFVERLSEFVPIDSYGSCLNNKTMPEEFEDDLIGLFAKYKFVLSVENAECEDYATEKLWNALIAGSIPIYLGAPNIKDLLPNPESAIVASDFKSIAELSKEINRIDSDDQLYREKLKFKQGAISSFTLVNAMESRKYNSKDDVVRAFECQVCDRVSKNFRMNRIGFKAPLPYNADITHYGCPKPQSALGIMGETTQEKSSLFQQEFSRSLLESLVLEAAARVNLRAISRAELDKEILSSASARDFILNGGEKPSSALVATIARRRNR